MSTRTRLQRQTPKGAAADNVAHARSIADEAKAGTRFLDKDKFAYRFNDLLRAGRAALAVLPKETSVRAPAPPGKPTMPIFVKNEVERRKASDPRFKHFHELKDVSAHDLTIKPDRADVTVTLSDGLQVRASVGVVLGDAEGRISERRETAGAAIPEPRPRRPSARSSVLYFLNDWPTEDLVAYCREVVKTLDSLINDVYVEFP
jgi:hypothetical protein